MGCTKFSAVYCIYYLLCETHTKKGNKVEKRRKKIKQIIFLQHFFYDRYNYD